MATVVAAAIVSEAARERETFKYDSLEPRRVDTPQRLISSSILSSSPDPALTAFAQLGLFRLRGSRALVSLFDRDNQHIVAEAQQETAKQWYVGGTFPRSASLCEHVINGPSLAYQLPVSVIADLSTVPRYAHIDDPSKRFYVGVPIRSPSGVNIGVFCVFDDAPRPAGLDDEELRFMQDLSQTIMAYLESKRSAQCLRREKGMIRGLESFVEGGTVLSMREPGVLKQPNPTPTCSPNQGSANSLKHSVDRVFAKAANIIRQSIEVEGVLFLDATVRSFGGLVGREMSSPPVLGRASSDSDSSDDGSRPVLFGETGEEGTCSVLGFSTANASSINGDAIPSPYCDLKEIFLQRLLRRHPHGKIFTYDTDGSAHSDLSNSDAEEMPGPFARDSKSTLDGAAGNLGLDSSQQTHTTSSSHLNAAATIIKLFPGARSVAVVPLWDAQRNRWYAGGFFWSTQKHRIFTVEQEISYLRVFGLTAMAEVARLNTKTSDKTKTDIIGSISHELRSPLHGVVGAVELLRQTQLDDYQENIVRTIQLSGRTLLDTIDNLLDHSKASYFARSSKADKKMAMLGHFHGINTARPKASLANASLPPVQLDCLLEEIVETILTSYSFSYRTTTTYIPSPTSPSLEKSLHLDSSYRFPASGYPANVKVLLDIGQAWNWCFSTHPGAIRRIVMNLLGNALKFTNTGHIHVSARQEILEDGSSAKVVISVEDSGKGMSEDFLRNHLFTPFSQEDHFAPGTGLGLSLVRKMVSALNGNIKVSSRLEQGTTITVALPLPFADGTITESEEEERYRVLQGELKGKRIQIFESERPPFDSCTREADTKSQSKLLAAICEGWLGMQVLPGNDTGHEPPDFVIYCEKMILKSPDICPYLVLRDLVPSSVTSPNSNPTSFAFSDNDVISSPIGPRKLALALHKARNRWISSRKAPTNYYLQANGHPPDTHSETDWMPSPSSDTYPRSSFPSEIASPAPEVPRRLPETNDSLQPRPLLTRVSSSLIAPSTVSNEKTLGQPSIIVVDDNLINLKILTAYMKKLGMPFVTASNGLETLEMYRANPSGYKCVLTDISMPVMDGLQATLKMRHLEHQREIKPVPVIAPTGLGGPNVEQDARASGVNMVLTKPVGMKKLLAALRQMGIPMP